MTDFTAAEVMVMQSVIRDLRNALDELPRSTGDGWSGESQLAFLSTVMSLRCDVEHVAATLGGVANE